MRFKYLSHHCGRFFLRTIDAAHEDVAWEIIEALADPSESGFLIPIAEWERLLGEEILDDANWDAYYSMASNKGGEKNG